MKPKIFIASDHAGFLLKQKLIVQYPHFKDCGTQGAEPRTDYPLYADAVCRELLKEGQDGGRGILVCGTGQGMAMRANRYFGVRAALAGEGNPEVIKMAREHNDANVLCLGARILSVEQALKCVEVFLATAFSGGRHKTRTALLDKPVKLESL